MHTPHLPLIALTTVCLWATTACSAQDAAVAAPPVSAASAAAPEAPATSTNLAARVEALKAKTLKDMVFVKGGTFKMGDFGPIHSPDRLPYSPNADDKVLRDITLDSFSIGAYKVTYQDFDVFTDSLGRPRVASEHPLDLAYRNLPGTPAGVNWNDARAYCQWIGQQLKLPMDLATEAQWEYAARSRGQMQIFPTDNGKIDDGRNVVSFDQLRAYREERNAFIAPMPVNAFPPNELGIYGLIGNGFEWVLDWYAPTYSTKDQLNPQGPVSGTEKVLRGYSIASGDTLIHVGMSFTRRPMQRQPPNKRSPKGQPSNLNQNAYYGIRCAVKYASY